MLEFARTLMGKQFFDGTIPRLIKAIENLTEELKPKEVTELYDSWKDDKVQFARLVCEFVGIVDQPEMNTMLCKSMDLTPSQLGELLRRAEKVFEDAKERHRG